MKGSKAFVIALAVLAVLALTLVLRAPEPREDRPPAGGLATTAPAASETSGSGLRFGRPSGDKSAPRPRKETLSEFLKRLSEGGANDSVTSVQINAFLERNHGSADAFLGAYHANFDTNLLLRAAQMHPEDPRLQFLMIADNADPANRREWIERLKQSDPENPLAWDYSAIEHFKAGDTEAGLRDLAEAYGKEGFKDYVMDTIQSAEELYLESGYSPAQAKALATVNTRLPHLQQLRDLGRELKQVRQGYLDAGNQDAALDTLALAWRFSQQVAEGVGNQFFINELVGVAIGKGALSDLPGDFTADFLPADVATLRTGFEQQRAEVHDLAKSSDLIYTLDDEQLVHYLDREKLLGERAAAQWLIDRHGPRP